MKCNNIIKYGIFSLSISALLFYLIDYFLEYFSVSHFIANTLLFPVIIASCLLFLYALYCLGNLKEKLLGLILIISLPCALYYIPFYALRPNNLNGECYELHQNMYDKEVGNELSKISSELSELNAREGHPAGNDPISKERIDILTKELELRHKFEVKWDKLKQEGELLAIGKKSFIYKLLTTLLFGIASVSALYASSIYTVSSIIGVSLIYVGIIALGLMYYAGSLSLSICQEYFCQIHYGINLAWLELIFLLLAISIVLRAAYKELTKR